MVAINQHDAHHELWYTYEGVVVVNTMKPEYDGAGNVEL